MVPRAKARSLSVAWLRRFEPECLALVLEHAEVAGIWGGTTEAQRARLRRNSEAAARPPCDVGRNVNS